VGDPLSRDPYVWPRYSYQAQNNALLDAFPEEVRDARRDMLEHRQAAAYWRACHRTAPAEHWEHLARETARALRTLLLVRWMARRRLNGR
jgi:hypothetical protein